MPRGDSRKEIEITKDLTIPKLWQQTAKRYGNQKVAMREKEFGIWIPITWQQYARSEYCLGLVRLGLNAETKW
jgi:long-chain acyl-CoA synthetase